MPDPEPPDDNQDIVDALARATGTKPPTGEELLEGDPELQRQLREAKEREKKASGDN